MVDEQGRCATRHSALVWRQRLAVMLDQVDLLADRSDFLRREDRRTHEESSEIEPAPVE